MKENQTSIEILEKNLGDVDHLKDTINTQNDCMKDKLTLRSNLQDNIKKNSSDCDVILKQLLNLHYILQKETCENTDNTDAKAFWLYRLS